MKKLIIDIKSTKKDKGSKLSNFTNFCFEIDGVKCNSMEGFLQSLKYKDTEKQKDICKLIGKDAKKAGEGKNWNIDQILYWQGKEYPRKSQEYLDLLERAYYELAKNKKFVRAILRTKDTLLRHSIGKKNKEDTILTENEFMIFLYKLRYMLQEKRKDSFFIKLYEKIFSIKESDRIIVNEDFIIDNTNLLYCINNKPNIKIPNCITNICENAFYELENIESIILPNKLTNIGNEAFAYCRNLQKIKIPKKVQNIGENVFMNCVNLKKIKAPKELDLSKAGVPKNSQLIRY